MAVFVVVESWVWLPSPDEKAEFLLRPIYEGIGWNSHVKAVKLLLYGDIISLTDPLNGMRRKYIMHGKLGIILPFER